MIYKVHFLDEAEKDLFEIYDFVKKTGYPLNSRKLLSLLEKSCSSLSQIPERGHAPPELERIGVPDYRKIHLKAYRIIYRIIGDAVYIYCVLDGRRDIQDILAHRLLQ